MKVAIFDFDGTIYAGETFPLLMKHLKTHPNHRQYYGRFFRRILPRYISYKLKLLPEGKMRERSMQIYASNLAPLSTNQLAAFFSEAANKMVSHFNPQVVERIHQHHQDGIHIMLVSGAFTILLKDALQAYPFDCIIGTDIPLDDQGIDVSKPIYHIQGSRKNKQIEAALQGMEIDWENSFAYADSLSDLSVLELVGNPVAVQPDQKLEEIAIQRSWDIISA